LCCVVVVFLVAFGVEAFEAVAVEVAVFELQFFEIELLQVLFVFLGSLTLAWLCFAPVLVLHVFVVVVYGFVLFLGCCCSCLVSVICCRLVFFRFVPGCLHQLAVHRRARATKHTICHIYRDAGAPGAQHSGRGENDSVVGVGSHALITDGLPGK
jgi:hypothetical protein